MDLKDLWALVPCLNNVQMGHQDQCNLGNWFLPIFAQYKAPRAAQGKLSKWW